MKTLAEKKAPRRYEALGEISAQHGLQMFSRQAMLDAIAQMAPGTYRVLIEALSERRSDRQNKYWHGVVVPAFAEHCGYEFEEAKDALALHLLPQTVVDIKTGEERTVPGHTSDLTVKDFNELIRRAQQLGAEIGLYVPDPNEAGYE